MRIQYVEAGEIVTTHGIRGEFKVLPWSDGPEFLVGFSRVRVGGKDYQVETCRVQKNCDLLKLAGIDTVEDAMMLRGKVVEVYRSDVSGDVIFAAELIGVRVYSDGVLLGEITEVLDYPGNKVYVVQGEHSYMIPAVKRFILSTDLDKEEMQVKIIEGMQTDEN